MLRFWIPVVCALAILPSISNAVEKETDYRLSPGDTLNVSVWGEDKLKQEVIVLPNGSITFPLAGQVDVAGLDATAVERENSGQACKIHTRSAGERCRHGHCRQCRVRAGQSVEARQCPLCQVKRQCCRY